MLNRRGFLRGMLIGASATAGTALVQLATPGDVEALALRIPTLVGQPVGYVIPDYGDFDGQVYIRHRREYVPVGYVTRLDVSARVHEEVSWTGEVCLVPGLKTAELFFEGR